MVFTLILIQLTLSEFVQGVPGERYPRRGDLHRARQEEDCDRHGRGVRAQEAGPHPLRVRRLRGGTGAPRRIMYKLY